MGELLGTLVTNKYYDIKIFNSSSNNNNDIGGRAAGDTGYEFERRRAE